MGYTIEQMSDEMHRIIATDPGPEGRKKVCALVQKACADKDFVTKHLPADGPERRILYEDPELSFCILAHVYHDAKESAPHDHGPISTFHSDFAQPVPATHHTRSSRLTSSQLWA